MPEIAEFLAYCCCFLGSDGIGSDLFALKLKVLGLNVIAAVGFDVVVIVVVVLASVSASAAVPMPAGCGPGQARSQMCSAVVTAGACSSVER